MRVSCTRICGVREGYLCLRRGLEPPLDLGPLALRLRDLRLQRGPLRRYGVLGARTRALQLRRLKITTQHHGQGRINGLR